MSTDAKAIYETITTGVDEESMQALYESGYTAYTQADYETATTDLQKVVDADESYDNGNFELLTQDGAKLVINKKETSYVKLDDFGGEEQW